MMRNTHKQDRRKEYFSQSVIFLMITKVVSIPLQIVYDIVSQAFIISDILHLAMRTKIKLYSIEFPSESTC